MDLYVRISPLDPGSAVQLTPCDNRRDLEGMAVPCPHGCLIHFDAWATPEPGLAGTEYPNSVLSWIEYLPGTRLLRSWNTEVPQCVHTESIRLRLYANIAAFETAAGQPLPVWVVLAEGTLDGAHYVALFGAEDQAETFYNDETSTLTGDCRCVIGPSHRRPRAYAVDTPDMSSEEAEPTGTRTAIIHDRDGTYFSPSGLVLSTLTDHELERLFEGEEGLLNRAPALPLLEVLSRALAGETWIAWT